MFHLFHFLTQYIKWFLIINIKFIGYPSFFLFRMDIDYAPSGREFATGSYDRTVRIFPINEGRSREIFHGQRMQKVFAVSYSQDNQFIFCGSEDMNIRIWKSIAYKPLGTVAGF